MGIGIQGLLNNFLFIIIPLFLYQIFWLDKKNNQNKKKPLLIFIMSFVIILCMSFPVELGSKFLFDLRYIPFIIGTLYLGFPASLTGFILIISYRYILGGDGIYINLFVLTIIFILSPSLKNIYSKLRRKSRIIFASGIAILSASLVIIFVNLLGHTPSDDQHTFGIAFVLIQGLGIGFVTYLIEEMSYNKKTRERIHYAEKLNTISDLSASISHEIRNPLTVTKGFLQLLYHNDLSNEKKKTYIDFALMELERGEMIITDFLSLTKKQIEKIELTNIIKEIQYTVNIVTPYALIHNINIKLDTPIKGNEVWVNGDYNEVRQCLINLAKNSIEAMPNGGELVISISTDKNKALIEIKDTGIGMSKEELSKIGTPYYTTKEKGTGLGTTLIFATVHSMKGKIEVKSEKGKGTHFSIRIPIAKREKRSSEQAS